MDIFPQTHKIIAHEIYKNIKEVHHFALDEKILRKASVEPDFALKYKRIRHYKEESLDFVTTEIVNLIYLSKILNYSVLDRVNRKLLSAKLGVISHYLSDYVCLPHKERWTFKDSMRQHIRYEGNLTKVVHNHDFNSKIITVPDMVAIYGDFYYLKGLAESYIEEVIGEYSMKRDYSRDLDFALSVSLKITDFIIEVSKEMNRSESLAKSFVF